MLHLSTVEDVFDISKRGIIVVPGIPKDDDQKWKIRSGEPIMLETPDGTIFHTVVCGMEMTSRPDRKSIPLLLGPDITKQMVPVGTKLWVNESAVTLTSP